ncbi:hypothetical protein BpHYR1_022860 [Brachionus plicatilis]|uniref:Uncharacterized protein n=1 Tax=Brachionus plicatilis TaxID=10195 RepID=A0A3M7RA11_BRAPC|nr:hypothetical protein BpHYR1_022860 [Brachionus plicatilis]
MTGISRIAVVVGLGINCCAYAQGFTTQSMMLKTPDENDSSSESEILCSSCETKLAEEKENTAVKFISIRSLQFRKI